MIALIAFIVVGLVVGHILGGPDLDERATPLGNSDHHQFFYSKLMISLINQIDDFMVVERDYGRYAKVGTAGRRTVCVLESVYPTWSAVFS